MKILVTNDDGYQAGGLTALTRILRPYGDLLVVAPKCHQSGVSMSVSMGYKPIAVKKIRESEHESWYYLDGTPASCVKFALDNILVTEKPDLVVSGINHGGNYATAVLYSATIGAAMEGAVNRIPSIGVSMDDFSPEADFSAVEELFPAIFEKFINNLQWKYGQFYNVNFPALPASGIKGVKVGVMGHGHWEKEYRPYNEETFKELGRLDRFCPETLRGKEPGEEIYVMAGDFTDESDNGPDADNRIVDKGYIAVTAHNIDNTDRAEGARIQRIFEQ